MMGEMKTGGASVAESVIAELEQTPKTPIDTALADIRRAVEAQVAPGREAARDEAIREYGNAVKSDPLTADYLDRCGRARTKFWTAMRIARAPLPEPSQKDTWAPKMVRLGWSGFDIDRLFARYLGAAEKISAVDWEGATIGERVIKRRRMRRDDRPAYSTVSDEAWVRMLGGPIRRVARLEPDAVAFED